MKKYGLALVAGVLIALIGCGGGGGGDSQPLDSNGAFDMRTTEIFTMFGAIGQECSAHGISAGTRPETQAQCEALCGCSIDAVKKLENRTSAPELTTACNNYCSPNFDSTDELDVAEADVDNEPDYDKFYLAYIMKCDEVGHDVTFSSDSFVDECKSTCDCLADTITEYESEADGTSFKATCETQCATNTDGSVEKSKTIGAAELFLKGGLVNL